MNYIFNGGFDDTQLSHWGTDGGVTHVPHDGHAQLGAALIPASGSISQPIFLPCASSYTVWFSHKNGNGAMVVTNATSATIFTASIIMATSWQQTSHTISLPAGTYTITISADTGGSLLVDDVSVAIIPATRLELAHRAEIALGSLATTLDVSSTPVGEFTEGDYTMAVTKALLDMGAVNDESADVRFLSATAVETTIDRIVWFMLPHLHNRAMTRPTSSTTGPVQDTYQTLSALEKRMGITPGLGRDSDDYNAVTIRPLRRAEEW